MDQATVNIAAKKKRRDKGAIHSIYRWATKNTMARELEKRPKRFAIEE
jgi:hypothetical protein